MRRLLALAAVALVALVATAVASAMPQSYLPSSYTWLGRPVQVASVERPVIVHFLHTHPRVKAFSGFRRATSGDHRCGMALDLVPIDGATSRGYAVLKWVARDAVALRFPYVEPLALTWYPGNHHLHVSFRRCS